MSAQKRRLPAMAGGATGRVNNSSASTGRGVEPGFRSADGTVLPFIFSCGMHERAWNIRSLLGEHAPSCTDEFRGKGDDQNIRMHPSRSCFEPRAKSMVRPSVSPHQDRSGALDEQRPQIAVASLGYSGEDRSIVGRSRFAWAQGRATLQNLVLLQRRRRFRSRRPWRSM
jgi:hypothetical protein